ncbi:MAG: glycosyltransferase family 4 protein [Bryobacteraceae bacterium]
MSHSPWIAGAERVLLNLLQNLPEGEIQPVVVFPVTDGPMKSLAKQKLPFPIFELPYGLTIPNHGDAHWLERLQQETAALTNLYRELELDAVVVNTVAIYPASAAAIRARVPLVVHCHGALLPRAFPGLSMEAWHRLDVLQFYMADLVLTPSRWVGDHLRTVCKVAESRLQVLVNGTELPPVGDSESDWAGPDLPEFAMLTTLEPHKGVPVFLEAAASFLARRPSGARFLVYGDGSPQYRRVLEGMIQRRSLRDCFVLRPKQEADPIYRRCCAAVVASEFEPFSMVAIEAMSYAKPVIATRCGGPEEILDEGRTGFLIPVGDSETLAGRMLTLAGDPALRREMGLAGRRRAESVYDIRAIARRYLDSILSVVEAGDAPETRERKRFLEALIGAGPSHSGLADAPSSRGPHLVGVTEPGRPPEAERGRLQQEAAAARRLAAHWVADQAVVSELYAQASASPRSRLSGFRSLLDRGDTLWDSVSPAFSELKSYTGRHFRRPRTRLVLGADLAAIPFREYVVPFKVNRLDAVSLAIRPLQWSEQGSVGIEFVSSLEQVVAQVLAPVAAVRHDVPTRFAIVPPLTDPGVPWRLRVFAKDVAAPVAVWELIQYVGLSSVKEYLPFVLFEEHGT